ncbi:MAG: methylmalonyl Co-A mutase-associated GTPase MeaB [Acidobacteriota bacterium]
MGENGLVPRLLDGDVGALARAISLVENGSPRIPEILGGVYPRTGQAYVIGVTGPPGAGKSSLVNALTSIYRRAGKRVGIIAVDPSSAFSGGAILGDRIRMQSHAADGDVFIRSMANRGHPGGLAKSTHDVVDLLDAAGFSIVILETVGVGQDEVEIVRGADTVCVVLVPGLGDDIQSIKAGIMEIAHVFVVNKADREGADRVSMEIDQMLSLSESAGRWRPPIVSTVATTGEGVVRLTEEIDTHRAQAGSTASGAHRRRELSRERIMSLAQDRFLAILRQRAGDEAIESAVDAVASRKVDPYRATDALLDAAGL